jgi:cytoskeleton protein RodZ
MSVRDVSVQMHLDERTLVALESDDFQTLPAPTFIRGYLRGYARLLGVPVGPVMEAYDREGFKPPELVADIAEKPQTNSTDFPMRLTTYAVVVVLVALVAAWWNNQGFDELGMDTAPPDSAAPPQAAPAPQREAVEPTPEPRADATTRTSASPTTQAPGPTPAAAAAADATPAVQGPAAETTVSDDAQAVASVAEAPVAVASATAQADAAIARAEDVLERARDEIVASAAAPDAPDATVESAPATPQTTTGASMDSPAPAASGAATVQPPAPAAGRLRIRFPDESWVEVYDRNDRRLFFNLVQPGRELELSGEPPLRVLLGRAAGVTVEFDGEAVDLAPHTERGVARFTLER